MEKIRGVKGSVHPSRLVLSKQKGMKGWWPVTRITVPPKNWRWAKRSIWKQEKAFMPLKNSPSGITWNARSKENRDTPQFIRISIPENGMFPYFEIAYPEQQLPGVPHELGDPQQPPEPGSVSPRDVAVAILWADSSFVKSLLPHCLQTNWSCLPRMRNSLTWPHFSQRYS